MIHFGIIGPPVSGHIHPLSALGRELQARGHRVTFFQMPDLEEKIRSECLEFQPIGHADHPRGSLRKTLDEIGRRKGLSALRYTIGAVARTSTMLCRDAPAAILNAAVDALLIDQMEPAGGAVAEHLGLPFVTVCSALAMNRDPVVPPPFTPWLYRESRWAAVRNRIGYAVSDWLTRPVTDEVIKFRRSWHLPTLESPDQSFSKLAQVCQMPREFDFPRADLPPQFRYVGPLRRPLPQPIPFPWDWLDGRPIVYATLGTLQNAREPLFRCFAEACRGLDVQLVVSHGGGLSTQEAAALPGKPLVVGYAPQLELLSRSSLTITHAGLNTVLDSLTSGVPLVTIPITYEQPAIARRVEWVGAGKSISLTRLDSRRLMEVVRDVLSQPGYRQAAQRMSNAIGNAGGVERAADIVEGALGLGGQSGDSIKGDSLAASNRL